MSRKTEIAYYVAKYWALIVYNSSNISDEYYNKLVTKLFQSLVIELNQKNKVTLSYNKVFTNTLNELNIKLDNYYDFKMEVTKTNVKTYKKGNIIPFPVNNKNK